MGGLREKPVVEASVGVIRNSAQRIFVTQRSSGGYLAGYWEFPGGKVEPGEMPRAALERELYEELGISVKEALLIKTLRVGSVNSGFTIHFFLVENWDGEPYGREGQPCRWLSQWDLKADEFPPANGSIIDLLLRGEIPFSPPSAEHK